MGRVVIVGTTEIAELAHFYLTHDSEFEVAAFAVDRAYIKQESMCGLPVVPLEEIASRYPPSDYEMLVAMLFGRVNRTRAEKYAEVKAKGYHLISYVSSKAVTWPGLVLGANCMIMENAVVQPFARIGNNVIVGPGTVIGHHCHIQDHCFLSESTALLGCATLEPYCFVGAHATIRDDVRVAEACIIGAGVTISKSTRAQGVYVNPPPELLPKPSNELAGWLTWPAR